MKLIPLSDLWRSLTTWIFGLICTRCSVPTIFILYTVVCPGSKRSLPQYWRNDSLLEIIGMLTSMLPQHCINIHKSLILDTLLPQHWGGIVYELAYLIIFCSFRCFIILNDKIWTDLLSYFAIIPVFQNEKIISAAILHE